MNTSEPGRMNESDPDSLDGNSVTNFLQMAVEQKNRPVDQLIYRLMQADGEVWLASALERSPDGSRCELLREGKANEAELDDYKQQAKDAFAREDDADVRLAGLLHYLIIIAAGLNHKGTLLSSQPGTEISATLFELAVSLPAPWNDFIAEAALKST